MVNQPKFIQWIDINSSWLGLFKFTTKAFIKTLLDWYKMKLHINALRTLNRGTTKLIYCGAYTATGAA